MANIPRPEVSIVDLIYKTLEDSKSEAMRLTRIGASSIGEECLRSIWYEWRGVSNEKIGGRILRLFETGHLQEARVVLDLKRAGLEVWDVDKDNKQFTYTDSTGHFVVKLDGVVKGVPDSEKTPHVLEIKTHNKNSFSDLAKNGVQKSKPDHYAQMHSGMLFSKLKRSLYVALCKDDESFYVERIVFDEEYANKLSEKINRVISAKIPPVRAFNPEKSFECKWCDSRQVCMGQTPLRHCRTCENAEAMNNGEWACNLLKIILTQEEQLAGCSEYSKMAM